jgi:pyruvate formate lyase activating enzyme
VWTEVTTLLIPGKNDSAEEVEKLSQWLATHMGPEVPLHFSAFHPDFKMTDLPHTPPATLTRAREIALKNGLKHVYVGNVHDIAGDTTYCSACSAKLIVRDWYELLEYRLTPEGKCPDCGHALAGRFSTSAGTWGRKRLPVQLALES